MGKKAKKINKIMIMKRKRKKKGGFKILKKGLSPSF
jgi:hypothetical protein